jgi:hypothetical protein
MNVASEIVARTLLMGIGATAVMDVVAMLAKQLFGVPKSDWAMVGRWVGNFPRGQFRHDSMAKAPPIDGELALGWIIHYLTGIAYAALAIAIYGLEWARQPTLGRAVLIGTAMIVAPFFIMQPGMGAGIAASKTPNPRAARLRSLMNHVAFGVGIYLAGSFVSSVLLVIPLR